MGGLSSSLYVPALAYDSNNIGLGSTPQLLIDQKKASNPLSPILNRKRLLVSSNGLGVA